MDLHSPHHSPSFATLTEGFARADEVADYCIPVNTAFPPKRVMDALMATMPYQLKYYPSKNGDIGEDIAAFAGLADSSCIAVGNGSTELIAWLNTVFIHDSLFVPVPSFGRWVEQPEALGTTVHTLHIRDEDAQRLTKEAYVDAVRACGARNAVLCNPNNPTGTVFTRAEVLWILEALSDLDNVVIDESFVDFSDEAPPTVQHDVHRFANAWVLKSMGKNVGLHGLRMGYVVASPERIERLKKHLPLWNVNGTTERLLSLLPDERMEYERSRRITMADSAYLHAQLSTVEGLTVFPVHANFAYVRVDAPVDGLALRDQLFERHGCFVRNCANKLGSTPQHFRIAARPKADVDALITALKTELGAAGAIEQAA